MTASSTTLAQAAEALEAHRLEEAHGLVRAALAAHPHDAEAWRLLGCVARAGGKAEEAEQAFRRAIQLAPRHALAHADLCGLLSDLDRAGEAIALLDRAAASHNQPAQNPPVWTLSLKAATWMAERRPHDALPALEALVRQAPHAPVPWINLAEALQALGHLDRAVGAYRHALAIDPYCAPAWLGLANLRVIRLEPADVAVIKTALGRATSDLARVQLGYALGKALGDQAAYEESFRHFERANALRGALTPHDPQALDHFAQAMERIAPAPSRESGRDGPIFIVGMPRSGSTLVEQILACHPQVEALGELFELQATAKRIESAPEALPAAISRLTAEESARFGDHYLRSIQRYRRTGRPFFTDKMPANWQLVPLIRQILPNARIVDVRRDPAPCCLSAFMTYFNRRTPFPANLPDLTRYYDTCRGLMDAMRRAHPAHVHLLRYEALIAQPKGEVRRLLDFLRLDFDPACLRPHDSARPIFTPSAQQVRKPMGNKGFEGWRNYERWFRHANGA
ncbi:Tetratricopeptide TPR_2 repeat-containing protein [Sphingobium chlorophenolicum L-1]|uniref:Tetratricopeptide TPR_2 repeat-containing protein n=1 Tax=Sphingobium chlorophenolicum L-1 TaxID=690566 RepID=F6F2E4_SPHCR|nr:sulfotransferase [Sphingobium chlorophenolicum]AEG50606.1 Tetratricopeptide TPR_2 repeat-containing protein [Sphingobium chlorophenolicum L-1]